MIDNSDAEYGAFVRYITFKKDVIGKAVIFKYNKKELEAFEKIGKPNPKTEHYSASQYYLSNEAVDTFNPRNVLTRELGM